MAESSKAEILQSALFSDRVRGMVEQYKEGMHEIEQQINSIVSENFGILNLPDGNRLSGIVKKHIANLNAELMGVKNDFTHFELDNLSGSKSYPFTIILRPLSICWGGDRWGRQYEVPALDDGGHRRCSTLTNIYMLSLYSRKADLVVHTSQFLQVAGGTWLESMCPVNRDHTYVNRVWNTSGSGSVGNKGSWGDRSSTHAWCWDGWGIPDSGFYEIDTDKQNFRNALVGQAEMIRIFADGTPTNEKDSTIYLRDARHSLHGSPRVGDFLGRIGHYSTENGDGRYGKVSYACEMIGQSIQVADYLYYKQKPKIFVYYWSWIDEVGNEEDVKNIQEIMRMYAEVGERWRQDPGASKNPPVFARNARLDYDVWLPKGERHGTVADESARYVSKAYWKSGELLGNWVLAVLHYRHFGVTDAEAAEDKKWLEQARMEGEPILDLAQVLHDYSGNTIKGYVIWGRFFRDQKKYHTAKAVAELPAATEQDKKNYENIRRWYFTKWDKYRDKSVAVEVNLLSNKMMELLNTAEFSEKEIRAAESDPVTSLSGSTGENS